MTMELKIENEGAISAGATCSISKRSPGGSILCVVISQQKTLKPTTHPG
jgi:hypothetical protein